MATELVRQITLGHADLSRISAHPHPAAATHYPNRYVDACTDVICYASSLRVPLQAYCARRRVIVAPVVAAPVVAADASDKGCAAIRRLYSHDWALYQKHCLATVPTIQR